MSIALGTGAISISHKESADAGFWGVQIVVVELVLRARAKGAFIERASIPCPRAERTSLPARDIARL